MQQTFANQPEYHCLALPLLIFLVGCCVALHPALALLVITKCFMFQTLSLCTMSLYIMLFASLIPCILSVTFVLVVFVTRTSARA